MLKSISIAHISTGFVTVVVGYTSSAVIVFQAAAAAGASPAEINSWLLALGIGMGLSCVGLSLYFRHPIVTAWSTPGAALLITSLEGLSINEAIGVFIFSSCLITLSGITGWFEKIMNFLPRSMAAAMLAGVLLKFGMDVFVAMQTELFLVVCMLLTYLFTHRFLPRYTIPLVLAVGMLITSIAGVLHLNEVKLALSAPVFVYPHFSFTTLISVGLPLFLITMVSQNAPGIAVLRANGYQTPASPLIASTGFLGVILAPFGGYAFNLAAITAAICMGKEADENPARRYLAAVWAGIFYLLLGVFGATVSALFSSFPKELVLALAGLALLGVISNSLKSLLSDDSEQEAAVITFLVTASGITLAGIGSAFWGLVIGLLALYTKKIKIREIH
ncbi:benzoate/H(+) symporter BenE family transporter [Agarilytica rhodophyticola]|uniref:benzoate/H(+) symporter BenE family transporter n=1 Tax=Agarilytica rhodophyticola TaxID=1737490 RepID=UPI000B346295|nr:benzoate/H(+) symporter BenE family transporter [Agarilytica rhodophyticola]